MNFTNYISRYTRNGILCLSNSGLTAYMECPRRFLFRDILSLRSPKEKPSITFGSSFHAALEQYYCGDFESADDKPEKTFERCFLAFGKEALKERSKIAIRKDDGEEVGQLGEYSLEFGFELLKKYIAIHPLNTEYFTAMHHNGEYYVELGFAIDLTNGILIGLIDLLGTKRTTGRNIVVEHKTTKQTLNARYLSRFNPNTQVSSYLCASQALLGAIPECALINVIRVKDYKRGDPKETDKNLFARIETARTQAQLEQHLRHMNFLIGQIQESITYGLDGFPQHAPNACMGIFGECEYKPLCMCNNEVMIERLAEQAFVVMPHEPYNLFENVKQIVEIDGVEAVPKVKEIKKKEEFVV